MRADDEDALTWDEVSDPTHTAGPLAVPPEGKPPVEPAPVDLTPVEPAETAAAAPGTSSFLLVTYGILGGVVLLYTVGWVLGIRQVVFASNDTLSGIASFVSQVLAVAAPFVWFGGSFVVTRGRRPISRLLVLLLGLVVTLPLPFVLLGASS